MDNIQQIPRYRVFVTKAARRAGKKLGLSTEAKKAIIYQLKELKYWPDTSRYFEFEKINGALKFNFDHVENKWVRVFCYQDNARKVMWIFMILAKKQNRLTQLENKKIELNVRRIEKEITDYKMNLKNSNKSLKLLDGGKE